jgi:hypothetical protein
VVRNGYHRSQEVLTNAGAVQVTAPRVNDKRTDRASCSVMRSSPEIPPARARKTPEVTEVLPLPYCTPCRREGLVPALASSSARQPAFRRRAGDAQDNDMSAPLLSALSPAGRETVTNHSSCTVDVVISARGCCQAPTGHAEPGR